jgi:spermidine synthase
MSARFEELDFRSTVLGDLVLIRRRSPSLNGQIVHEVKLDDAFLMSSVVTHSERALADLPLAVWGADPCEVLIGGLGLGCTAATVLRHERVRRVDVVEYLEPVIDWHRRRLVPDAETLMSDPRCHLIHDDFFRRMASVESARRFDLILLDIDHSPVSWLQQSHQSFYAAEGLQGLVAHLNPGGVFGLWSAESPPRELLERLGDFFETVEEHEIRYHHPMFHEDQSDTVVVAH